MPYEDLDYEQDYGGIGNTPMMQNFKNYVANKSNDVVNAYNDFADARDNFTAIIN